ncbi:MAG TPA: hypothetical protein VGA06_01160 [Candidatus Paceibacterota bacterium]|jgi:hypothetical protein
MKPKKVREAQLCRDIEALSAMGKAGARNRAHLKRRHDEIEEIFDERRVGQLRNEEQALRESTNEHTNPFE